MKIVDKKNYDIQMFLKIQEATVILGAAIRRKEELEKKMGLNEEEVTEKETLKSIISEIEKILQ
ncbi:hypothetical protein SAMN02745945_00110 [Peptoclostridium litorale DSM 5388]|uniref:Uncharacterized protein n=1 Tax=Peptoclostridium litorale DSM 5388 TaxID=1121324 RepID=A0A069RKK4_PEPLI|nr:hypothetical protein [Peptoclostridium litorale]KDR96640.1 hypothetical protein CLIT_2c02460 [Peptoclostridium litorale DSM 5388]SIN68179.1 hypothetical protein SAMN02745945_00110 [Peptoclostridium litorale DSM 5388]